MPLFIKWGISLIFFLGRFRARKFSFNQQMMMMPCYITAEKSSASDNFSATCIFHASIHIKLGQIIAMALKALKLHTYTSSSFCSSGPHFVSFFFLCTCCKFHFKLKRFIIVMLKNSIYLAISTNGTFSCRSVRDAIARGGVEAEQLGAHAIIFLQF